MNLDVPSFESLVGEYVLVVQAANGDESVTRPIRFNEQDAALTEYLLETINTELETADTGVSVVLELA